MTYLLDTHPLIWWLLEPRKLSRKVTALLTQGDTRFLVPTMALLEMEYLVEIGRIEAETHEAVATLSADEQFDVIAFDATVLHEAIPLAGTRDPFDRIIAATAIAHHLPLVTRDDWMHTHLGKKCVW
ncbi:MAG: type II toxin-antitoxin system VapC family toxin [Kiritimatiellae bacterium]|nr:type II toxin-antitoxin system VapC family toxin [Kiritimatiellia bacterium]